MNKSSRYTSAMVSLSFWTLHFHDDKITFYTLVFSAITLFYFTICMNCCLLSNYQCDGTICYYYYIRICRVDNCALWFLELPHSEAKEQLIYYVNILRVPQACFIQLATLQARHCNCIIYNWNILQMYYILLKLAENSSYKTCFTVFPLTEICR